MLNTKITHNKFIQGDLCVLFVDGLHSIEKAVLLLATAYTDTVNVIVFICQFVVYLQAVPWSL